MFIYTNGRYFTEHPFNLSHSGTHPVRFQQTGSKPLGNPMNSLGSFNRSAAVEAFVARRLDTLPVWDPVWLSALIPGQGPFQTRAFLDAWLKTLGRLPGAEAVIVEVQRVADGAPAALFVMAIEIRRGLRCLTFADNCVSDNNAPLMGPAFPDTDDGVRAIWAAARKAMPRAHILRLEKLLPVLADGRANPMLALSGVRDGELNAHPLRLPEAWETYSRSRMKHFRKEQERVWRVFTRHEGAAFEIVRDPDAALNALLALERMQDIRMQELGATYCLDDPAHRSFYRELLTAGLKDGTGGISVLRAGDEIVAALFYLRSAGTTAFVRLAHLHGEWRNASPGRVILEQTLKALHAEGSRLFDFSIGDYPYKFAFNVGTVPLKEIVSPMSARALPIYWAGLARRRLRRVAWLRAAWRRMRGLPPA
jgi:CelD/BcsL family acetyltransferase involved in cellulose biosynthesis